MISSVCNSLVCNCSSHYGCKAYTSQGRRDGRRGNPLCLEEIVMHPQLTNAFAQARIDELNRAGAAARAVRSTRARRLPRITVGRLGLRVRRSGRIATTPTHAL